MLKIIPILLCSILMGGSLGIPVEKVIRRTPTLLISLDGFQAAKLDKFINENPDSYFKKYFVDRGVKAEYMKASFPTLTFPNHFTLVTGLYQESHGIVGNTVYDPDIDRRMNFLSDSDANNPIWWNQAEPIWLTAKKQGFKTGSFFWTGSEVWTRHPDIYFQYSTALNYFDRCEEVVTWFKKFDMDFATLYFNEPDSTGHSYGPESSQYMQKIRDMDEILGYLVTLFIRENLFENVNMIVVSDHGMADMKGTVLANTLITSSWVNSTKTIYGIVSSIWPVNDNFKEQVYNGFKQSPNLDVYYKEDMPADLNYKNNKRIGPIIAIAKEGYTVSTQTQTNVGNHGFDNRIESMRAIFLAHGPDFKRNVKIDPVDNVDVYPLICELVNIKCNPNNGTASKFINGLTFTPVSLN